MIGMALDIASGAAIVQIGAKAHAALRRSGGKLAPLSSSAETGYCLAGDEIVWVGSPRHPMHPRAVQIGERCLQGDRFDVAGCAPWRPAAVRADVPASVLRANCHLLRANIVRIGEPKGFGAMLAGGEPDFPLDLAKPYVREVAAGIAEDEPNRLVEAALRLLGFGPGLTPSGDDFVGAVLFAKHLLRHEEETSSTWEWAARTLAAEAKLRSNVISAALFADLADGQSFAPLHSLAQTMAAATFGPDAIPAARAVVAIGHSSGWDMLAGLIVGITGTFDHQECGGLPT